jgi:heavy metal sensor kinase
MTLTDRLSASFLGALALILVGFSTALYVMASATLHQSVDDRLEAALATLAALAEDEPGGLDWEPGQRQVHLGQDKGKDEVRWVIRDDKGNEVDRSRNLGDSAVLVESGSRRSDRAGHPWRVAHRLLNATHPALPDGERSTKPSRLVLSAGLRLDPIERQLWNLALVLVLLSTTLWGLTALVGRRLCRTALAPLTRMAVTARDLGADEPGRRLPVARTGDELEDLASAFNGLLDRWHEALERQSRFAGDASHQLRTPLTALIGQVDVALRRERTPEEYRRTLARVRDQSDRLRTIVEALLFLARADAEAGLPSLDVIDLAAWTGDQLRRRADEGGHDSIRWDPPPDGPILVRAHPALLAEVLDNLLDNARDHGRPDSPVDVRIDREPGRVSLSVHDQGRGIAPSDLPRIFEPFFRANDARRAVPGGVGLGLAVARRIALALGGSLEAESRPGEGSRFVLRLPELASRNGAASASSSKVERESNSGVT